MMNGTLIRCLCTINDYIVEDGIDLSTYVDTLEKKKYPEDVVNSVRVSIANIRESLREICPEPKPMNPDEELQLSVDDAIKGINSYIENGGHYDDISSAPYSGHIPLEGGLKD